MPHERMYFFSNVPEMQASVKLTTPQTPLLSLTARKAEDIGISRIFAFYPCLLQFPRYTRKLAYRGATGRKENN